MEKKKDYVIIKAEPKVELGKPTGITIYGKKTTSKNSITFDAIEPINTNDFNVLIKESYFKHAIYEVTLADKVLIINANPKDGMFEAIHTDKIKV